MEEQIKEFWEWCGLNFYECDGRLWAETPSGGAVELTLDLNSLFKYAVPKALDKLYDSHLDVQTAAEYLFQCWLTEYDNCEDKDFAQALFKAIRQ